MKIKILLYFLIFTSLSNSMDNSLYPDNYTYPNDTQLQWAAIGGKVKKIYKLLRQQGTNINSQDDCNGKTSLMYAIQNSHIKAVKKLLLYAAKTDIKDCCRTTALGLTLEQFHYKPEMAKQILKLLIDHGVRPERDSTDYNKIILAICYGNKKYIQPLLDLPETDMNLINKIIEGSKFNKKTNKCENSNIIHYKLKKLNFQENLKEISELNENLNEIDIVDIRDDEKDSLFIQAIRLDPLEAKKLLQKYKNIKINYQNHFGMTPLMHIAERTSQGQGLAEVAKMLVEKNADLNIECNNGTTAFGYAVDKRNFEIIKILLPYTDLNNSNITITPIMMACFNNDQDMVKYLIEKKASLDATNKNKETPLMLCARNRLPNLVTLLLQLGANPNILDPKRNSFIDFAAKESDNCFAKNGKENQQEIKQIYLEFVQNFNKEIDSAINNALPSVLVYLINSYVNTEIKTEGIVETKKNDEEESYLFS